MAPLRPLNKSTVIGLILIGIGLVGLVALWIISLTSTSPEPNLVEANHSPGDGFVPLMLPENDHGLAPTSSGSDLATAVAALNSSPLSESSATVSDRGGTDEYEVSIATPTRMPVIPTRLIIPKIDLDAPIVPARVQKVKIGESLFEQWSAPDEYAVGWHTQSALLGQVGNTVLNGHHNIHGKVFERLHELVPGDLIVVEGGSRRFAYVAVNIMILPERDADLKTRLENARWIQRSDDERLTLVTCWPANSNTHRLIVVAAPLGELRSTTAEAQ